MTETRGARRRRLAARLGAEAQPRIPLPDKIYLPDQSQVPMPAADAPAAGKKGRHLGGRRVDTPRSERRELRLTRDEAAALEAAALAARMTVTSYICWRTFGEPPARPASGPDVEVLRKILAQMGKRGSNLNQIAHHLNSCDFRDTANELGAMQADHMAALEEHREVCRAIMQALGV